MSKNWFVTLDGYLSKDREEPIISVYNTEKCVQKEGSYYHIILDNDIQISFEVPIVKIENEDDL